tara:strand:+ start:80 stop:940 length:861 start_codon:yes stop_codon:yes gene_type:complete
MTLPTLPTDLAVANQSFPAFRTDLNLVLDAIKQNHAIASSTRPAYAEQGMFWLDYSTASAPILKFYDGSDDITFATFNVSANTVNVADSAFDIVSDTSPQLGGSLDVNGNSIVSASNGNIAITPNGSGKVILDGLSHPTADGSANQVLKTDGGGNLAFVTPFLASAQNTFTKAQVPSVFSATLASVSGVLDFDTYQNFIVTLSAGANTFANPTTEASQIGQTGVIIFIQRASGNASSLSFADPTDYETAGSAGITLSTEVNDYDVVPYIIKADNSILLGNPQLNFG